MALFRPILGDLRGRIGADVFSHNKGGDYVRRGTSPTNPNTTRQAATRSLVSYFATAWNNILTDPQREAWNVYAETHPVTNSLGEQVLINGLAWYVKCNTILGDAGETPIAWPPDEVAPEALTALSIDVSAGTTVDVTWTPALEADEMLQVWVSMPVTQGSSPNKKQCRLAGYSAMAAASPQAITTPHYFQSGLRCVSYVAVVSADGLFSAYRQAVDDIDY